MYSDLRYRNFPREEYFGLGPDSLEENASGYRWEEGGFDIVAGYQFARWIDPQGRLGYMTTNVGPGTDGNLPDTESVFDDTSTPGLGHQPDFFRFESGLFLGFLNDPNLPGVNLGIEANFAEDCEYSYSWSSFDNLSGNGSDSHLNGKTTETRIPVPKIDSAFLKVQLRSNCPDHQAWFSEIEAYLRNGAEISVVGLERSSLGGLKSPLTCLERGLFNSSFNKELSLFMRNNKPEK